MGPRELSPLKRIRLTNALTRFADGERGAFDEVYAEAWPVVRGLCMRLLKGLPDAEDAAQETLLKVFGRVSQYRAGEDALTWILTIAFYECRTTRKKSERRREQDGDDAIARMPTQIASPETEILQADLRTSIAEVLSNLSEIDRETIAAAIFDQARPEVAAATFRKRLERAMYRFKEAWGTVHVD